MNEIKEDLKEVKSLVIDLVKESSIHNEILRTHEARSLALQKEQELLKTELQPIKEHVSLINKVSKVVVAIGTGAIIQWIVRFWI